MLDRPDSGTADPLSQVLALLRPRAVFPARLEAGGDWGVRMPAAPTRIKLFALLEGSCWMRRAGVPDCRLQAGDGFLMTRGEAYVLASDLSLPTMDGREVASCVREGRARLGDGIGVVLVAGRFEFEASHADVLLDMLPPVVRLPASSQATDTVRWALGLLAQEARAPQAGAALMRSHLSQVLLLQILRAHLASRTEPATGWLAALADPRIGPTIARLHAEPTARWTLEGLAEAAAMSRSSFAARFKALVGLPPLDYLQRLRMLQAGRALRDGRDTVSAIAASLGYDSDSAFSHAFKRVMGASPSAWRASVQLS